MLLFMLAASFLLLRVAWWNFTSVFMRREVITINPFEWLIERDFGLWQGRHHLQSTNLSNLQLVLRDNGATIRNAIRVYTDEPGSISVRHKRSRVALAFPATEAEARQIISAILRRVPGLARLDAPSTQKRGQAAAPSPWRIDQNVDELVVTLPVEQRWRSQLILIWYLLFGVAWVAGFGVVLVQSLEVVGAPLSFIGLLVIGAAMGLFASFWALRDLHWYFHGQEVIAFSANGIRVEMVNSWLSRPRVFRGEHIRGLRVAPLIYRSEERLAWLHQPGRWGALAFDYGAGSYRFGNNLGSAEAAELLQLILKQFPQYGWDG